MFYFFSCGRKMRQCYSLRYSDIHIPVSVVKHINISTSFDNIW